MSYAVSQYFQNGGTDALIVRVHDGAVAATKTFATNLVLEAANPGSWGENIEVTIDHDDGMGQNLVAPFFNLTVLDTSTDQREVYFNLSTDSSNTRYVERVLLGSSLVRATGVPNPAVQPSQIVAVSLENGGDGNGVDANQITAPGLEASRHGVFALEHADLFNILVIPPYTFSNDVAAVDLANAITYCKKRRAILLVDPPADVDTIPEAITHANNIGRDENVALYYPRLRAPNPLRDNSLEDFAPSGAVAGVLARTDATRGVWKSAAGIEATINGAAALTTKLTDQQNGELNPMGINCLRDLPVYGRVVWGARTLEGADALASEWKYLSVRRTALFLEESLFRGTQWVVFEPNDEPLWSQIRLNLGAFMQNLFRQGAFQGQSPKDAYFVKCDKETTTQNDINLGIVNIVVGFAPLKPAEFVVIKLQQIAGQIQS